jgi:hypothetical protein
MGRTALAQGRPVEAQTLLHESVSVSASVRDRWGMGYALHHLGLLALAQGDASEAHYLARESDRDQRSAASTDRVVRPAPAASSLSAPGSPRWLMSCQPMSTYWCRPQ